MARSAEPIPFVPTDKARTHGLTRIGMTRTAAVGGDTWTLRFAQSQDDGDLLIHHRERHMPNGQWELCIVGAEIDGGAS